LIFDSKENAATAIKSKLHFYNKIVRLHPCKPPLSAPIRCQTCKLYNHQRCPAGTIQICTTCSEKHPGQPCPAAENPDLRRCVFGCHEKDATNKQHSNAWPGCLGYKEGARLQEEKRKTFAQAAAADHLRQRQTMGNSAAANNSALNSNDLQALITNLTVAIISGMSTLFSSSRRADEATIAAKLVDCFATTMGNTVNVQQLQAKFIRQPRGGNAAGNR
jgi:hypothetical protein